MPPDTSPGFPMAPKASWWNHKAWKLPVWGWIVAGVIGLTAIGAAAGSKNQDNVASSQVSTPATADSITPATAATTTTMTVAVTTTAPSTTVPPTTAAATTTAAPATTQQAPVTTQPAPETTQPALGSDLTPSQQAAVRSAQSYLEFMGFSRQGLIDQLSSQYGSQYAVEDATFAVDSLNVDWNAQAVKSANSYLKFTGFSCQGLIDQLSSQYGSQYTVEQATYAATQVGLC